MNNMHGEVCPICDVGTLTKKVIDERFEYKGKYITIPDYIIYTCNTCDESIVDNKTIKTSGKIMKEFFSKVNKDML